MSKDNLGDRMKAYEKAETGGVFMKGIPLIIRLDGRSFSKYTKRFKRPFDDSMSDAMLETTKVLVKEANALIGYTQSDEISLLVYADQPKSEMCYNGKKFKIISNLASVASVNFYVNIVQNKQSAGEEIPHKLPTFDCRAFQVPSKIEAWNAILWRVNDAVRNSISMLAHHHFSHKSLQNKNQKDMMDMLMLQKGINWNNLPSKYKEGRFVRTEKVLKTAEDFHTKEMVEVVRSVMTELELNRFNAIKNREAFLFGKKEPIYGES